MADLFRPVPIECEPKRKNRFMLTFEEEFVNIEPWHVRKVDYPTYCFQTGKWQDLNIELLDLIGPSITEKVYEQILLNHKDNKKNKYTLNIRSLDPVGITVEEWKMKGEFLTAGFGLGSYDLDEVSTINLKFRVSRCWLVSQRHLLIEKR